PGLYLPDRMPADSICTTWARRVGGAPGPCGASGMTCSRLSILPPGLGVPWHKQRRNSPRNPSRPVRRFPVSADLLYPPEPGRPDLYLCIDIGGPAGARPELFPSPKRPRTTKQGKAMKLMSPELSRRALVAGLGAAALPAKAQPRNGTRPRALALIGDRYHNPDYIHVSLDRVFHDLDIPI